VLIIIDNRITIHDLDVGQRVYHSSFDDD